MATKHGKCQTCGEDFSHNVSGRPPKYCPRHRLATNARKAARRLEETHGKEAAEEFRKQALPEEVWKKGATEAVRESLAPEFLAIGLCRYPDDIRRAANFAGLHHLSDKDLEKLSKEAKKHEDILKGTPAAATRLINTAIMKLAMETIVNAPSISPAQLGATIRSLSQSVSEDSVAYSSITIQITEPKF